MHRKTTSTHTKVRSDIDLMVKGYGLWVERQGSAAAHQAPSVGINC